MRINSKNTQKLIQEKTAKSIVIDLQKEYEEDKEIIDLIEGKRNYYLFNLNYFF